MHKKKQPVLAVVLRRSATAMARLPADFLTNLALQDNHYSLCKSPNYTLKYRVSTHSGKDFKSDVSILAKSREK